MFQDKFVSEHLNNTIFAFTGTLELMNRNDAKKKVENAGGLTKNSLTKKTTHLLKLINHTLNVFQNGQNLRFCNIRISKP